MSRLRVQLILAFTLVVSVAVGAIAALIVRTTNNEFRQYVTHSDMQASGSGLQQLVDYYQQQGNWDGVASLLGQGVFLNGPDGLSISDSTNRSAGPSGGLDVLLADAGEKIVYDSTGKAEGQHLRRGEKSKALSITQGEENQVIGYLLLSIPRGPNVLGQLEQRFLDHTRQILIAGASLAVVLAVLMGALLSRNLTAPLQRLSSAARAVAAGNLQHRVAVEGSTEMIEVAQAFNDMTTALRESERQRQNMVADVAHELRTPLSVVQGNLRAILDDVYLLDKSEISRLYDETRLINRLVDDLRELALVDAGRLCLNLCPTDLCQLIYSTVENLAPAAQAEEVALTAQVCGPLPIVQVDPDRVAQILRNLLFNALRHTPPGGSVTVTATPIKNAIEVAVADTGEGIDSANLPHIFERFWRADPARAGSGSTGLGLSVAQSLAEAQGGRLWATSTLGQGSTFRFTLPCASTETMIKGESGANGNSSQSQARQKAQAL